MSITIDRIIASLDEAQLAELKRRLTADINPADVDNLIAGLRNQTAQAESSRSLHIQASRELSRLGLPTDQKASSFALSEAMKKSGYSIDQRMRTKSFLHAANMLIED